MLFTVSHGENNSVTIKVKGRFYLTGLYANGESVKPLLNTFQGILLKGADDVSGMNITSEKPVAVFIAHTFSCNTPKCKYVLD